jgi:hypothetical protein
MNLDGLVIKNDKVKLINPKVRILLYINKSEKVVELMAFYKNNPNVKGRCVLRDLLEYILSKGYIDDGYIVEVMSPTPKKDKTMNNTIRMYKNMGFNQKPPQLGKPVVLEENIKKLINKLCNNTVPKPNNSKKPNNSNKPNNSKKPNNSNKPNNSKKPKKPWWSSFFKYY